MVVMVTAVIAAVILSAMALEPEDCTYWRRWLSLPVYFSYRLSIAVVPGLLALLASMPIAFLQGMNLRDQLLQGLGVAVFTAAVLRANPARQHFRHSSGSQPDREVSSALSWLYERCCMRLDKAAGRGVRREMSKFKARGFEHAEELVALAEEVVELLNIERADGESKADRTRAEEKRALMQDGIDVLHDPLAETRQRRSAVLALAERLGTELIGRRWDQPPVHQQPAPAAPVERAEEKL